MKNYVKLILLIFIIFIFTLFFIYLKISPNNKNKLEYFNSSKNYIAKKLYNNIKNSNKKSYTNPDEVMQKQIDILMLLYGGMVKDDTIYKEIIKQQRKLFSQELLDKNSFDSQYNNFLKNIEELKKDNIICIKISKDNAEYTNNNKASIKVKQIFNKMNNVDTIYYLEKFENNWKITSWKFIVQNDKKNK